MKTTKILYSRLFFKIVFFAALLLFNYSCKNKASNTKSEVITDISSQDGISKKRDLKVVGLSGSGYDLGLKHGRVLSKEISEIVEHWKQNTSKALGRDANDVLKEFMSYANFEPAIKKWTPELYEEIKGIADGSNQKFEEILVLNLLDEFWVYIDALENHHCSDVGIAAKNGNPAMVAQNMDIEDYTDGYQILMRIEGSKNMPQQFILSHPGLITLNGMNSSGVGVVVNTIMQLKASNEGVPVAFVVRKLVGMTDKDAILDFIKNVPHASGQNYIISVNDEVYDFEASAGEVVRFIPKNQNGAVYHTNHPEVNTNVKSWDEQFNPSRPFSELPVNSNSYIRFKSLETGMTSNTEINVQSIMDILRSKDDPNNPVCRTWNASGGFTFASTIMVFGDNPHLLITAGPPDESEYKKFEFE
ncbi:MULTISPECIES: C45 family peptidase [Flavobacteriaceae]|jgi:predicted choloylglycine hydrolase|uniref:C45 family autoproteolytic acyltransferase/hydolase n=1 Tax=Flavobacteriaceae TaxID=49546 RepID=UPI0005659F6D|nr:MULTISPECIES: C45 family peptidase [Flavobacteriaceae]SDS22936.1 Acyl-coenzyme A:6-aminopenicillanic acid acyl-transferase [Formosa sp. Hel1_31_208]